MHRIVNLRKLLKHWRKIMNYKNNIKTSAISIYDAIDPLNEMLYIPTNALQKMLADHLVGFSLSGLALRTRSKIVKQEICKALGYPIPKSFRKTQPRFLGQNFDVYTQKSLNVQIWNEEVDANRRYVFLKIDDQDLITHVKIITGDELVQYDKTGTLTKKYQATMYKLEDNYCSLTDSENVTDWIIENDNGLISDKPNDLPTQENLLPITEIFTRLRPLIGTSISYLGAIQERNRGAGLHELVCKNLGFTSYEDDGTYPDIKNQLLEIKLQTSPTIDLGLHSPTDQELILSVNNKAFYSSDIRYVIFDAVVINERVNLNKLYVVSGVEFITLFPLFKGRGTNSKIQLPLPSNFFK